MLTVPAVVAALLESPRLRDAACAGQSPWWDVEVAGEEDGQRKRRLAASVALCRTCPALSDCAGLLKDLPPDTSGVWAARVLLGRRP